MIKLENISKRYGDFTAVDQLNLEVAVGEFCVFVGSSGCGKTTTLRMIAGLETPDEGNVYLNGQNVNTLSPGQRDVGLVFQSLALFPHMSVRNNIAFGLKIKKASQHEIQIKVDEAAAKMHITSLLDKSPAQLSGGEAQRVALARTLIVDPHVYLLDEPLSNLDAKLKNQMRTEIKRLHRSLGKTFVHVTHDQEEAMTLADNIVVMRGGQIQQVGPPMTIYNCPTNQFVADFFGTPPMNFVPGQWVQQNGRRQFVATDVALSLDAPHLIHGAVPGAVTLGVRPEDVSVSKEQRSGAFPARVDLVEPVGDSTVLYLRCGAERALVVKVDAGLVIHEAETVWCGLKRDKVHFFDPLGLRLG